MRKPLPSVSTRTAEFTPRELPLLANGDEPRPSAPVPPSAASTRIREVLRRFFEEEL